MVSCSYFYKSLIYKLVLWQEEDLFTMSYGLPLNVEGDEKCLSLLNVVEENISRQLRACKAPLSKRKPLEGIHLMTYSLLMEAVRIEGAWPLNYFEIRFWKSQCHYLSNHFICILGTFTSIVHIGFLLWLHFLISNLLFLAFTGKWLFFPAELVFLRDELQAPTCSI